MYKKVKDNTGGSLIMVLFALVLISLTMLTVYSQINNQIRINANSSQRIENKVVAESGIESSISEYINQIEIEDESSDSKDIAYNLSLMYAKEAEFILSNEGNGDEEILKKIRTDIEKIVKSQSDKPSVESVVEYIEKAVNDDKKDDVDLKGNKDNIKHIKIHLKKSSQYLGQYSNTDIINNISTNIDYLKKDLETGQNIKYQVDGKDKSGTIMNLLEYIQSNLQQSTDSKIQEHIDNIDRVLNNWSDDFASTNKKHYGNNSENINIKEIGKLRLEIVKKELQLLKNLINDSNTGSSPEILNYVKIKIPVEIKKSSQENDSTINCDIIKRNMTNAIYTGVVTSDNEKKHQFKIENLSGNSSIVVPLILKSETKNKDGQIVYTINAEVELKLQNIISSNDYEIEYEIVKWNE